MSKNQLEKKFVYKIFDKIADRYDFVNHIISFGTDFYWRKKFISYLPTDRGITILDIASGSANIPIAIATKMNKVKKIIAYDASEKMLRIGIENVRKKDLSHLIQFIHGDMHSLPFDNESFDCVTMSFGLRNSFEISRAISEMKRVLKPQGKAFVMEFSIPNNKILGFLYKLYFKYIMPFVAGLMTKNKEAYIYLYQSVEDFYNNEQLVDLFKSAGLKSKSNPISGGIVWIYEISKSA